MTVIGNGMMARAFSHYHANPEVLVFASGVSNSQEKNRAAFQREEDLLRECLTTNHDMLIVYFSTCAIFDQSLSDDAYVQHKRRMEETIAHRAKKYLIFRLPQAVGKTNNTTLVRYLRNMVETGQQFEVWAKSYRNLIDCEDAFRICSYIIERRLFMNSIVNVASTTKLPVTRIVEILEDTLHKKADYSLIDKGGDYDIDVSDILTIIREIGIQFDEQYPERLIRKYYGSSD